MSNWCINKYKLARSPVLVVGIAQPLGVLWKTTLVHTLIWDFFLNAAKFQQKA